jgi:hypothetical protein
MTCHRFLFQTGFFDEVTPIPWWAAFEIQSGDESSHSKGKFPPRFTALPARTSDTSGKVRRIASTRIIV